MNFGIRRGLSKMDRYLSVVPVVLVLLSASASHKYVVLESDRPRRPEKIELKVFTLAWFVPVMTDLDPARLCPGSRIRMINMYDNALDGMACGATLLLICPHTVGVECEDGI